MEDIQNTELSYSVRASVDGNELFVMEIGSVDKRGFLGLSNLVWAIAGGAGCVVLLSVVLITAVACGRRRQKARRHYQRTEISMGPFPPQELEVCVGEYADAWAQTPVQASRRRPARQAVQSTPESEVLEEFVKLSPPAASIELSDQQWEEGDARESGPLGDGEE